jgi:hypothetical protein
MAVPAVGVITLDKMPNFLPSRAIVFVNPMIAAFAVEYYVTAIRLIDLR